MMFSASPARRSESAPDVADVVVVGAGIVGLATALALGAARPDLAITVLEKEAEPGTHQSANNSGVIHAGLYYRPGSLKARLATRGRGLLERFCGEQNVAFERCGKIVVAVSSDELPRLGELERRGRANGLVHMVRLGPEALREHEPHAAGVAALFVPESGIVDYREVTRAMARVLSKRGTRIKAGARVMAVRHPPGGVVVETTAGEVEGRVLVGCAGLESDRLARLSGCAIDVAIVPFRGEYWMLAEGRRHLVRNLIYPVPDPAFPFLGVHFTRRIGGAIEAGPNAVLALAREGYTRLRVSARDVQDVALWPGFWRMARRHWRTALAEQARSLSRWAFARACARLVPEVTATDLAPGGAGVRAQAVARDGSLVDDFSMVESGRMVHVINAPSPAATASLAIGQEVALRVLAKL